MLQGITCAPPDHHIREERAQWQKEWRRLDSTLHRLPDDFEKTTYLRTYCAKLIDVGRLDPKTILWYRSLTFDSIELYRFYPLFQQDSIPADCGITSYFFIKLAQSFGYKAYQYSFGFVDTPYTRFIHSFPIVEINYKGTKRIIIQDPYLNATFRNHSGEPVDFYNFLTDLKQKNYGTIQLDSQPVWTKLLIADTLQYWPYLNDSCKSLMRSLMDWGDGRMAKQLPLRRDYQSLMQSPCDNFERGFIKAMQAHGYAEPFIYAYTLRVNEMAGSADVKTVETRIDSVLHQTFVHQRF